MPIYVFHCSHCNQVFESLSKPNDPVQCKHCHSIQVVKQITAPGTYKIMGDNSASVTPKRLAGREEDRRLAKRERVMKLTEKLSKE